VFDELPPVVPGAVHLLMGCGVLVDNSGRMHSDVAILGIETADGNFVRALDAYQVPYALNASRRVLSHCSSVIRSRESRFRNGTPLSG
jgi:hypothetical protein